MCVARVLNGTTEGENYCKCNIMPQEKSTRQIVREEIKRAKELEKLEAQHDAGEISDFEYKVQKFILNTPQYLEGIEDINEKTVCYSTTA